MILALITCAALLLPALLLLGRHLTAAHRRRQPALVPEPTPTAPGAPVAARAPGAANPSALSPRRRRHDNRGHAHFAGPITNAARRTRTIR